jgi:hypothetical protein
MRSGTRRNRVMARTRQQNEAVAQAHRLWESARALTPSLADIAATSELFFDLSQLVPVLGAAAAS